MAGTDPLEVVQAFCHEIAGGDLDAITGYFTDDAVYHNIPIAPVVGPDQIRATLEGFLGGVDSIEFQVLAIAAVGEKVLTERVDVFNFTGGHTIALPVMGTFEVDGAGQITAWRDYFDMNQFMSQLPQG